MAGIRPLDNAAPAGLPDSIEKALYTICSLFAICSFWGTGWWPVSTISASAGVPGGGPFHNGLA